MTTQLRTPADLAALLGIAFSDEQIEAITAPLEPGVIIAGAGTGKTTVIASRVMWLVGTGAVAPERVLGLTFTRKAAGELSSRIREGLARLDPAGELFPEVATYDGFAAQLVGQFGAWLGLPVAPRTCTDSEAYLIAEEVLRARDEPWPDLTSTWWPGVAKSVLALEERIRSHLLDDRAIRDYTAKFLLGLDKVSLYRGSPTKAVRDARAVALERLALADMSGQLRAAKQARGVASFADQMAMAVELAVRVPAVGPALRSRYDLVVVDEFQDTSPAQARLLSALFGSVGGVTGSAVTAVGDPMQAIYTWRGASADNMQSFNRLFPGGRAEPYQLSVNRRSGQAILSVANAVGADVRAGAQAAGMSAVELRAADGAGPARVDVREFTTWLDEAEWIADQVAQARASGDLARWDQCAILLRRNADIGEIARACRARDIPVAVQQSGSLLSVPAVSAVVAMLAVLANPDANPEVVEILSGPRFRVGPRDLRLLGRRAAALAEAAGGTPVRLLDAVADPGDGRFSPHARSCLARLTTDIGVLGGFDSDLVGYVRRIISVTGLDVEIMLSQEPAAPALRAFMGYVARFAADHPGATPALLSAYLEVEAASGSGWSLPGAGGADAVAVMTVHKAKGLEWDQVYLPSVVDSVFPENRLRDNPLTQASALPTAVRSDASALPQIRQFSSSGLKAYDEGLRAGLAASEDRLAYVGLTRAKRRLVITGHRQSRDAVRPRNRSAYLETAAKVIGADAVLLEDQLEPTARPARGWTAWPGADDPVWSAAVEPVMAARAGKSTWPVADVPAEVTAEIADWDAAIARLGRQAAGPAVVEVAVPSPLSASGMVRLARDEQEFAARLARPLPSPPSRRAGVGAQFHAWVERYYAWSQIPGFESGPVDKAIGPLCESFLSSRFAVARPYAVELDFVTEVDGLAVSGRIDAVFRAADNPGLVPGGKQYLVVDWKTGRAEPDPLQLRIYARAWADRAGVGPEEVAAGFFQVRTGTFIEVHP